MFGDEDSVNLFHLVGIEGVIHEPEDSDFEEKFEFYTNNPEVGIIIVSERVLIKHRKIIFPFKMQRRLPIIVEIPSIIPEFKEDYGQEIARKYIGKDVQEEENAKNRLYGAISSYWIQHGEKSLEGSSGDKQPKN